ncbi:LuxR family transcriptional regulator [Streptomyces sp. NPDC052052]|uniref:LuxR family transcriptional regulator n=1 Tax=Streptomyces sp. NPDC052052 TaxID=3154756 RepID=UPI003447EDE4
MTRRFSANTVAPEGKPLPSAEPGGIGRKNTVQRLWETVTSGTGPAIQLLHGDVGAGRTTALHALRKRLGTAEISVYHVTCLPGDHLTPFLLTHRLVLALTRPMSVPAASAESMAESRSSPERHRPPAGPSVSGPDSALGLLDKSLRTQGPAVVLVDDAQHADPESLSLLRSLLPKVPSARLVMGVAPVRGGWPAEQQTERAGLTSMSEDGVVGVVDLPPLPAHDIARMLAVRLRAVPDDRLVDELHRLSGGNPAAVVAATEPADGRVIRVLIGHAHLVTDAPTPLLPEDDRFVRTLRGLGDVVWRVAKTLSLLEPMADDTARPVATATGLSDSAVKEALHRLVDHGFVAGPGDHDGSRPSGWRFRVPLVAASLQARLGPYERRVAAAVAVHALWETDDGEPEGAPGGTRHGDATARLAYLADRIVDAGALVDRQRAARELFGTAERLRTTHRIRAAGWLRAAVDLTADPAQCAPAVIAFASEALLVGDQPAAEETIAALARAHAQELDTVTRAVLVAVELTRLASTGDVDRLSARGQVLAADVNRDLAVPAAVAASLLGRWAEVGNLVERRGLDSHSDPCIRAFGRTFKAKALLMRGDPTALHRIVRAPDIELSSSLGNFGLTVHQAESLLTLSDLKGAESFLHARGIEAALLPPRAAFLYQFLNGAWHEALQGARRLMIHHLPTSHVPLGVLVHAKASTILLAQGWPSRARTVLDNARTIPAPMSHLLDSAEAAIHLFSKEPEAARETLRRGLAEASEDGCVLGTGPLWSALAILAATQGQADQALSCLDELHRTATRGDVHARLLWLRSRVEAVRLCPVLRARLPDSTSDAHGALALVRSLGQPYETALTLLAVARADPSAPSSEALLWEAYELFGHLDALLWRHRVRTVLREAGLRPPERRGAAREMDLLLARLVAEGLSNRRLAAALSVSETSVSSRLNRLFRSTGLRSRVELATAVATGDPLFNLHG